MKMSLWASLLGEEGEWHELMGENCGPGHEFAGGSVS